ncbi:MAG: hypothetical protein ACE5E5_02075 [Phycisphaerae bacterium]
MAKRAWVCGRMLLALAAVLAVASLSCKQETPPSPEPDAAGQHPHPRPRPGPSVQTVSADGKTTSVTTPEGGFESVDPFVHPPGTNFLETVYSNMIDGNGVEMPNTLPSSPDHPYNLHERDVETSDIDVASPSTDLRAALGAIREAAASGSIEAAAIEEALDIIEGNPLEGRVYSGFPLLHYIGPEKVKKVTPIVDADGTTIGGNVDVHQIWYDSHIESDTAFIDPGAVQDVPWTITYTVDVLDRGSDDFSPFVMYFDDPALSPEGSPPMPHVAMDQTFFPMQEGTRNVFVIKMSLGKYYNLTYTWGWRVHPPRVQVSENANKTIAGKSLVQWEVDVFGESPRSSEEAKLNAIAMIGDLAPAKRMWNALREAREASPQRILELMDEADAAFDDWYDRSRLPRGVEVDPDTTMTLFYVNNTIYGQQANGRRFHRWHEWSKRPAVFKATLLNGDHFVHSYMSVDFGGSRGWENQFQSTVDLLGAGCWFSFGRVHWWVNAGGPWGLINVPAADESSAPQKHIVEITLNFEPSRRLRLYQFDPLHHDVAVFSIH